MKTRPLASFSCIALAFSSLTAFAQAQPPAATPPAAPPAAAVPQLVPVPGTDGALTTTDPAAIEQVFATSLSGAQEVPPVVTEGSGTVVVALNPDGSGFRYRLSVENIDNVTAAHLHLGLPGENGPIVVPLLGPGAPGAAATPPTGAAAGVIAEGDISAGSLTGPLAGVPLSVLLELMRSGAIYANVHTAEHPNGEIRGQIKGGLGTESCQLLEGLTGAAPTPPPAPAPTPTPPGATPAPSPQPGPTPAPGVAGAPGVADQPAPVTPPAPALPPTAYVPGESGLPELGEPR